MNAVKFLHYGHRRELEVASSIDRDVVAERGYESIGRPSRADSAPRRRLERLGIPSWATGEESYFPGLLIPIYGPTGQQVTCQWKPRRPVPNRDGKPVRYISARGQASRLDVHPRNRATVMDPTIPLWITEGAKKADALTSRGLCVVALSGVFNWRSKLGTLGDWEDVPLKGREVVVCFDADARTNRSVLRAMSRLGAWLKSKGVAGVTYVIVPKEYNGKATKGADDFLAAGETVEELRAVGVNRPPSVATVTDAFSDARVAETIADDVLVDAFLWCQALGWRAWDGRRWAEATEATVSEAIRRYCLVRCTQARDEARVSQPSDEAGWDLELKGWLSMLSASRRRAVISDARGIVEHRPEEFDADPELLNTPAGVVCLRTRELLPHTPDLLMTQITSGNDRPGYTHPDWQQALEALPEPERGWYQSRAGQAITGHDSPDGILPVLQGGGENGKSALTTDGLVPALGDYASTTSPKLLQGKDSDHSTERAFLRGKRFLIAEELTEGRAINVTALKQIQDVGQITARLIARNNMSFKTTHSLFATTNYIPIVSETDHGTWRRLALLRFPYTFRKPGEALEGPNDRPGDPGLKLRIKAGASGQHHAIVTWAVAGAMRWYADPDNALTVTPTIAADTRAWRAAADRILGYWNEQLVADRSACVLAADLLEDFNEWLTGNGHNAWSKELFNPRFKNHSETTKHGVSEQRTAAPAGLHRRPCNGYGASDIPARPYVYRGIRFQSPEDDAADSREWRAERRRGGDGAEGKKVSRRGRVRPLPKVPDLPRRRRSQGDS